MEETLLSYIDHNLDKLNSRFLEDFYFRDEYHFLTIQRKQAQELRDLFVTKGAHVEKRARFSIRKALDNYRKHLISKEGISLKIPPGTHPPPPSLPKDPLSKFSSHPKTHHIPSAQTKNILSGGNNLTPKPSDVAKSFPFPEKYSGNPRENIRRRYNLFISACRFLGVNTEDTFVVLDVIQLVFLKGTAQKFFTDSILGKVFSVEEAISALESHFLHMRA